MIGRRRIATWLLAVPLAAAAGGTAHEHGVARVYVGIEGNTLTVQLDTPLWNLLGFERRPANDRERAAVRRMVDELRDGALFRANVQADCKPDEAVLAAPVLGAAWLGGSLPPPGRPDHDPVAEANPHADLQGSFTYICTAPARLQRMTITLADEFKRIRRIDVIVQTATSESRQTLEGRERAIRW